MFGSRLVFTTLDESKQVAFHRQILTNTITLEGDHFETIRVELSNLLACIF